MKTIFFIRIKTQFDNLGDALINKELISLCALHGKVFVFTPRVPAKFKNWLNYGNEEGVVYSSSRLKFFAFIINSSIQSIFGRRKFLYIQNPGGYIGEISKSNLVRKSFKIFFLALLKKFGIKIALIGASYESLGDNNKLSLIKLSNILDIHTVRDSDSLNYCNTNGIKVTSLLPDLAFNLPTCSVDKSRERICIISLRSPKDNFYAVSLVAMLKKAYDSNDFNGIRLIYQVERDEIFMTQFKLMLQRQGLPVEEKILPLLDSIEKNIMAYSGVTTVISNRLHVLLLALRASTRCVAIVEPESNKKIIGLFTDIGLGDFCITPDSNYTKLHNTLNKFDLTLNNYSINNIFELQRSKLKEKFKKILTS